MKTRPIPGISLRALAPNAVTAMALCTGLSGVWFAMQDRWDAAVIAVVVAGILDAVDGRIARMLKGESRFGAELDSLSDVIAFGVTPALILYSWALQHMPRFGWTICLFFALCQALRLARFNARIDTEQQPHKSAGFNTGVPAPAGAGLALLPMVIWLETKAEGALSYDVFGQWARDYRLIGPWILFVALLMISNVATYSWSSIKIRPSIRFMALAAVGLFVATMIAAPWVGLITVSLLYLTMIPMSVLSYAKVKRARKLKTNEAS